MPSSDGDGTLRAPVLLYDGAGMGAGDHQPGNRPLVRVGGGAGQFKGGRHLRYPGEPPLANLHLTVLEKFGMRLDKIHDSTGRLDLSA